MATLQGARTTFNDTVGLRQDISNDVPILCDPYDVPLYTRLQAAPPSVEAYKHEWLEKTLQPSVVTLTEAVDATETDLTVVDNTTLKPGDVLQNRKSREKYRVSAVAASGLSITVQRGYAGSAIAATTATDDKMDIIGQAVADGADAANPRGTVKTPKFNFQQTYQEMVEVTDLDQWTKAYGTGDKFAEEVADKLKIMAIRSEKSFLYGSRFEDSTNKTRQMGGLTFFISTNAHAEADADIDEDLVRSRLQESYDNGGRINLIAVGPVQKQKLSNLISVAQRTFPRPGMSEVIGVAADSFQSDFGTQEIMMDRNILADDAFYLEFENVKRITGQPFTLENLAKTGTSRKSQIVGWFSLELKCESHFVWSSGLKTTF